MAPKPPARKAAKKSPAKAPARRKVAKPAGGKKAAAKKAPAKKASPKKAAKPGSAGRRGAPAKAASKARFGRAGTAGKAEGDAAVRAWMKGVKPEHRPIVERLDALIREVVPDVRTAIKWSTPLYGREGRGFFVAMASFKQHVRVSFFEGADLTPPPPAGESKAMRSIILRGMADLDEAQMRAWFRQASGRQGWGRV